MSLRGKLCVAFLLTLIFTIYFLFSFYVPYIGDDYSLPADWLEANNGNREFSWLNLWNFGVFMWTFDNARLDNLVFIALRLTSSKWVLALVVGMSSSIMIWGASKLVSPNKRVLPYVITALWIWIAFSFPWRNGGMAVDNSFNLLLPAAVTVIFLLLIKRTGNSAEMPKLSLLGVCLVALVAGWIHEGFSVPICCGLGMWALMCRFKMPKQWWIVVCCYIIATVYVVSAPGIWLRMEFIPESSGAKFNIKTLLSLIMSVMVVLIIVLSMMIYSYRNIGISGIKTWIVDSPIRSIIITSFVIELIITGKVLFGSGILNPRVVWICSFFGALLMFQVISRLFIILPQKVLYSFSVCAIMLVSAFYINVIRVQKSIGDEECKIQRLMSESKYGTVYRDYDISLPKITLLHPVNAHWRSNLHISGYDLFMADGKLYSVVPKSLESLTDVMIDYMEGKTSSNHNTREWPQLLPGSAELFVYNGALIKPDEKMDYISWLGVPLKTDSKDVAYDYVCADGRRFDGMVSTKIRFRTRTGRPLIYIAPGHVKVTGPYESISLVE